MFINEGERKYLKEAATDILLIDQGKTDVLAYEAYALATLVDFIVSREEEEEA